MNQPHQRDQQTGANHQTKGSPAPDPGQAVESGEPTLTGNATDKVRPDRPSAQPDEGKHWESGEKK